MLRIIKKLLSKDKPYRESSIGFRVRQELPVPVDGKEKRERWKFVILVISGVTGFTRFLLKVVGLW